MIHYHDDDSITHLSTNLRVTMSICLSSLNTPNVYNLDTRSFTICHDLVIVFSPYFNMYTLASYDPSLQSDLKRSLFDRRRLAFLSFVWAWPLRCISHDNQ